MVAHRLIAIETSSPRLSLALGTESRLLKNYQGPLAWRHAESLFEGLKRLLQQAHWPIQSVTGVLVSTGPGSFTGIRIGLAVARALGQSLAIPVKGFSSLENLAQPLHRPGRWISPAIDALRGDVFTALYHVMPQGKIRRAMKEQRLSQTEWVHQLRALRQPVWVTGDAAKPARALLRDALGPHFKSAPAAASYPTAAALWRLGSANLAHLEQSAYPDVLPLYLRAAAARERQH